MKPATVSKIFLLVLVVAITATFVTMIRSFLMAVLLAGIFASLSQPVYTRLTRLFRGRRSAASVTTLLLIVLVIIIPLGILLGVVTAQAIKVAESITPWVKARIDNPDLVMQWLEQQPLFNRLQLDQEDVLRRGGQAVTYISRFLVDNLSAATAGTFQFLFMLSIMLYSMYFFLIDGHRLVDLILYYLPLEDADERRLLEKFRSVTRATLKGTAVIGILQGGLAGLAFAVVGIPSSVFWGVIMIVLSIIPGIGTGLIWVPASVILAAGGHLGTGIALAVFCAVVVGSVDNFLRPRLVGQDTKIPDLLILLGTLGGIVMFGLLGFIIGPIVAALLVTVWEIYGVVFRDLLPEGRPLSDRQESDPAEPEPGPEEG